MNLKDDTSLETGQKVDEVASPGAEDAYWRLNYLKRAYVERNRPYSDYQPAYRYGWESRARLGGSFRDVESELGLGWNKVKGGSRLVWTQAKHAASDAWHRIART